MSLKTLARAVVPNASGQEPIMDGSVYRNVVLTSPAVIQTPAVAVANAALTIAPAVMALAVLLAKNVAAASVTLRLLKNVVKIIYSVFGFIIPAILIKNAVTEIVATLAIVKLVWVARARYAAATRTRSAVMARAYQNAS
jgi:hypothetical protein